MPSSPSPDKVVVSHVVRDAPEQHPQQSVENRHRIDVVQSSARDLEAHLNDQPFLKILQEISQQVRDVMGSALESNPFAQSLLIGNAPPDYIKAGKYIPGMDKSTVSLMPVIEQGKLSVEKEFQAALPDIYDAAHKFGDKHAGKKPLVVKKLSHAWSFYTTLDKVFHKNGTDIPEETANEVRSELHERRRLLEQKLGLSDISQALAQENFLPAERLSKLTSEYQEHVVAHISSPEYFERSEKFADNLRLEHSLYLLTGELPDMQRFSSATDVNAQVKDHVSGTIGDFSRGQLLVASFRLAQNDWIDPTVSETVKSRVDPIKAKDIFSVVRVSGGSEDEKMAATFHLGEIIDSDKLSDEARGVVRGYLKRVVKEGNHQLATREMAIQGLMKGYYDEAGSDLVELFTQKNLSPEATRAVGSALHEFALNEEFEWDERISAVDTLMESKYENVVPLLRKLAADEEPGAHEHAVSGLEHIMSDTAQSEVVRGESIKAFAEVGNSEYVLEHLTEFIQNKQESPALVTVAKEHLTAVALGVVRNEEHDRELWDSAIEALRDYGDWSAHSALVEMISADSMDSENSEDVEEAVSHIALRRVQDGRRDLGSDNVADRRSAFETIGAYGRGSVFDGFSAVLRGEKGILQGLAKETMSRVALRTVEKADPEYKRALKTLVGNGKVESIKELGEIYQDKEYKDMFEDNGEYRAFRNNIRGSLFDIFKGVFYGADKDGDHKIRMKALGDFGDYFDDYPPQEIKHIIKDTKESADIRDGARETFVKISFAFIGNDERTPERRSRVFPGLVEYGDSRAFAQFEKIKGSISDDVFIRRVEDTIWGIGIKVSLDKNSGEIEKSSALTSVSQYAHPDSLPLLENVLEEGFAEDINARREIRKVACQIAGNLLLRDSASSDNQQRALQWLTKYGDYQDMLNMKKAIDNPRIRNLSLQNGGTPLQSIAMRIVPRSNGHPSEHRIEALDILSTHANIDVSRLDELAVICHDHEEESSIRKKAENTICSISFRILPREKGRSNEDRMKVFDMLSDYADPDDKRLQALDVIIYDEKDDPGIRREAGGTLGYIYSRMESQVAEEPYTIL